MHLFFWQKSVILGERPVGITGSMRRKTRYGTNGRDWNLGI